MKIENLINSVGQAIQDSYKTIELNSVSNFFNNYFDEVEDVNSNDVIYKPKTIEIKIPSSDDSKVILAPIATLVKHNHMNIKYVKVNLNINVTDEKEDEIEITSQHPKEKNSDTENKDNAGGIEIMFKCQDSPEGVSRIETHLNSIL